MEREAQITLLMVSLNEIKTSQNYSWLVHRARELGVCFEILSGAIALFSLVRLHIPYPRVDRV